MKTPQLKTFLNTTNVILPIDASIRGQLNTVIVQSESEVNNNIRVYHKHKNIEYIIIEHPYVGKDVIFTLDKIEITPDDEINLLSDVPVNVIFSVG